jgi:hypothetical protein
MLYGGMMLIPRQHILYSPVLPLEECVQGYHGMCDFEYDFHCHPGSSWQTRSQLISRIFTG